LLQLPIVKALIQLPMKSLRIFLAAALVCSVQLCFSQSNAYVSSSSGTVVPNEPQPLLVLKIDDVVTPLYPDQYETPALGSINSEWIKSIELIGPVESTALYGDQARDGAIVLEFKEGILIAKETLIKLKSK